MRFTAMAYNFLRVFEEINKQHDPEWIHPAEKKYTKALEKQQPVAEQQGCFVNPLHFQSRIARISSYTIRAVQSARIAGKQYLSFMRKLSAQLVPRIESMGEH